MAKLKPIPAEYPEGSRFPVVFKPLADGETFTAGDIVDMTAGEITEVSGADPTPLYGLAAEDAADVLYAGYVHVYPFTPGWKMWISLNSGTVAASHIDTDYGVIEDADGVYCLDDTDETNVCFYVHDIDTERNMLLVSVLAADQQYTP